MKAFVLLVLLVGLAVCHPTFYPDVKKPLGDVNPATVDWPAFRSFHVHILFQPEHQSDSCTGYDEAMLFRDTFMDQFHISDITCEGDFDQGRLCMFPTALVPFGPFPVPQWAAFVPLEDYSRVVTWLMQNRGPFSVFVHPNTGFERNDHRDWGVWMGQEWFLDLSAPEFVTTLPNPYPSDCRNIGDIYPIPNQTREDPPNTGVAHVRGFNAIQSEKYLSPIDRLKFVQTDGTWATPLLGHYENTWYSDVVPKSSSNFQAVDVQGNLIGSQTIASAADTWWTLLVNDGDQVVVLQYQDDNTPITGSGKIRFINLQDTAVYVNRNNMNVTDVIKRNEASEYVADKEGQYVYYVHDAATGKPLVSEPYYMNTENVVTAFIVDSPSLENAHMSLLLIQDYPHDAPRNHNERQP